MKLRVRGFNRVEVNAPASGQGFRDVIDDAARAAGVDDVTMLRHMSYFVEALADRVARGSIVTIPGFGKIAACYLARPGHHAGKRMRPKFVAHAGFRHQVVLCAPVSTKGNDALSKYHSKHAYDSAQLTSRPFKAMQKIRDDIKAQMAED